MGLVFGGDDGAEEEDAGASKGGVYGALRIIAVGGGAGDGDGVAGFFFESAVRIFFDDEFKPGFPRTVAVRQVFEIVWVEGEVAQVGDAVF